MDVVIRHLKTPDEVHACEHLQERAWNAPNWRAKVPYHLMLAVAKNGGVVLGAFDGDEIIGFAFGFLGRGQDGKFRHFSHMVGVLPEYQNAGVGYRLKLAQREAVLGMGLDRVSWTYDPLEARNAYLNLHKLGATCRIYLREFYGAMSDGLNRGLPSDRFEVDWWIASDHVQGRLVDSSGSAPIPGAACINETVLTGAGLRAPGQLNLDLDRPSVLVEVPADYQAIKAADMDLALEWRLATRHAFETYLAAGYTAIDFLSQVVNGERRSYYLLSHGSGPP